MLHVDTFLDPLPYTMNWSVFILSHAFVLLLCIEPDTGSIRSGSAQGSIKDEEPSRPPSTMSQKRSDSKASLHSAAEKKSSPAGSGASLHSNSGVKSNEQRPKSAKSTHSKSDSRAASSTSHHSEKVERSASQSSIKSDGHADDPKESEKRGSISSQTSVKSAGSGKSRSTSRASKNSSKVSVKPDDASVKQGSHGSVRSNTSPREAKASHAGSAASVKPPSRAGTPGSARSNASQHGGRLLCTECGRCGTRCGTYDQLLASHQCSM